MFYYYLLLYLACVAIELGWLIAQWEKIGFYFQDIIWIILAPVTLLLQLGYYLSEKLKS